MTNDTTRPAWEAVQQIDLLAGAWQLSEREMEQIFEVPDGTPQLWRHSATSVYWSAEIAKRLQLLHQLQYGLWLRQPPGQYAAIWRRPWTSASPIGSRSPLAAIVSDGQSAIEIITAFLVAG